MSGIVILLLLPLVGALIAAVSPKQHVAAIAPILPFLQIGAILPMLWKFELADGLQFAVEEVWIRDLGINFALGLDGLSIFMVALTVGAWTVATVAASLRPVENPRLFFFMLALAEFGTLGAFMAQDLILFILFFDLLLIPFYFLIGIWGDGDRRAATTKFMIYTMAGSLLMFVAALALGVLSTLQNESRVSFLFSDLIANPIDANAQKWIFAGFAIALLVKMPLPPLHGWMRDTYRSAPLAVLIPLSAVVAKLGAYGFLRIVLPLLPEAVAAFDDVMLVLALVGIIYGSLMAFTQDEARLVVGYSSIAQIGFVGLGIFALDAKGAEGAMLQMLNHGIVVIGLFLVIGYLADRAGSERLSRMGGIAKNAPVFALLFLIISLATLAMPGSANFVGELYILFGAFDGSFVYGVIATAGVALAAVYMIRFFQRAMHGPAGTAESRELDGTEIGLLLPAVLITLALAVYPQFVVERVAPAADAALQTIELPGASTVTEDKTESPAGVPRSAEQEPKPQEPAE